MGNLYFNLLNVNHAIYAKMLKQLIKKNAYEMQTRPSWDDNLIGRS